MRKWFLWIIPVLVVGCLQTACGLGSDTAEPTAVCDKDAENRCDETITLLSMDASSPAYQEFIRDAEQMLNIKINVREPNENADNRHAEISTILSSGDRSVDVITVNDEMMSEFKSKGYLEPISEETVSPEIRGLYPQQYLKAIPMEGDILYSVPFYMDIMMFWVNQEILDKTGIEHINNIDEFKHLAEKTRSDGTYGYGGAWEKTYVYNEIYQFVNMFGGNYLDWSDEQTREAVKLLHDMARNHDTPIDQLVDQYDQMEQKFIEGKYASIFMYSGAMNFFVQDGRYEENKIHIVKLPDFGAMKTNIATWQYIINNASDHKEAAEKFLTYCASAEGCKAYSNALHRLPARLDILDEELQIPDLDIMREYVSECELEARYFTDAPMKSISEMGENFQEYIMNEITLDEFCERAQSIVEE
ncbi:ABC transporter substrate-binding protein [Lachnoclostridium sp. Marseille-P6806]|uniref:ABC transporter substrate-binding protein n=1 Tax=Lachnoclostridium sp. Marseille-P6806 TaxID=2364793 RepID=UPI001031C29C|nr:extracellular solute-binding protein [Lachnoclostridium sp. Marseille-P6806]